MSKFMINYYSKLPNELQLKINKIIENNYKKIYFDAIKKANRYLIFIDDIKFNYFDYNEPFNKEYPHQLTEFFRHKYNPLIGNIVCNIGDIVINKNFKNTEEFIVLGFRYKYLESNLKSIVCFKNDIFDSYNMDFYNQRYILLGKLQRNIDEYNLSNLDDIEVGISNWKDKLLYTCYLDTYFIIKKSFLAYNNMDIVDSVRKNIGLNNLHI